MGGFSVHDHVRIVADNDWKGMIGIVRDISYDIMQISCINRPAYLYLVNESNIGDIELIGAKDAM
ncbi:MAG: hypothetical protein FWG32_00855 [Oscillospiraceae bacterium]|nr:hypothetical protein [Oscillospiraceae bacterium]